MTLEQRTAKERRSAGRNGTLPCPVLGHTELFEQMADAAGLTGRQRRVWLLTMLSDITDAEIAAQVNLKDLRRVDETRQAAQRKIRQHFGTEWKDGGGNGFLIRCVRNRADHGELPDDLHEPLPDAEWPRVPAEPQYGVAAKPFGMVPADLAQAHSPMRDLLETVCRATGNRLPRLVLRTTEVPLKRTGEAEYQRRIAELREKGARLVAAGA